MTNHIAVCIVEYHNVVLSTFDLLYCLFSNLASAHRRLEVEGRNVRRRNQNSILAIVGFFNATVEEEGYVSVFLSFGNTKLLVSQSAYVLAEGVVHRSGLESNVKIVVEVYVVLSESNVNWV